MGDRVFLKVSPWKGVLRFGRREKLRPRYIGPYEIIARVGPVAYRLDLPPELSKVHNVFHISMLRKYIPVTPPTRHPNWVSGEGVTLRLTVTGTL